MTHTARRAFALIGVLAVITVLGLTATPSLPTAAQTSRLQADPPADVAVQTVAVGGMHTCALRSGGVTCWGNNVYGQLGDGTTVTPRTTPVSASGLSSGVQAITAGDLHTCALRGGVTCWGNNEYGQLGDGSLTTRPSPVGVSGLSSGVQAIAAGTRHTCALRSDGGVLCWGSNDAGQLGDGSATPRPTPVDVSGLSSGVQAIGTGGFHSCALLSSGGVRCWGRNDLGQLGDGTTTPRSTPVPVSGLSSGVQAIAAGGWHTCALLGGGVRCWGDNGSGQLGDGTITPRSTPVPVSGLSSGMQAIAAGGAHSCAVLGGGSAWCWGFNGQGRLGDGTTTSRSTPVPVSGMSSGVQAIAAGGSHTCALVSGSAWCWGRNDLGQLGDGTTNTRSTPVNVVGMAGPVQSLTAGGFHTCAGGSSVRCWGRNGFGQLGDGTTTDHHTPVGVVRVGGPVQALSAGVAHTCALVSSGVRCWGANGSGQLGDGTVTNRMTARDVSGLTSGVQAIAASGGNTIAASGGNTIAASGGHTCALRSSGGVMCWGGNHRGQLGDGTTVTPRLTPVSVVGLSSGVQAIALGQDHSCALLTGGGVQCWGYNYFGQLGDGTTVTPRLTPVSVVGLSSGVQAITAGRDHTCALLTGGGVQCWGDNYFGRLGDGSTTDRTTPVNVVGLSSGVQAITAGNTYTCALLSSGGMLCWGDNGFGQLGDGTTVTERLTPVPVSGLSSGVQPVDTGGYHTCVLRSGGIQCWGYNGYGQLGDSSTTNRLAPVDVAGFAPEPTPTPTPVPTMPDANRNGVTDATDALCILRQLGGFAATANCPNPVPFGDVNRNGAVDAVDALCVLRYLGGFLRNANCPYDPPA